MQRNTDGDSVGVCGGGDVGVEGVSEPGSNQDWLPLIWSMVCSADGQGEQ